MKLALTFLGLRRAKVTPQQQRKARPIKCCGQIKAICQLLLPHHADLEKAWCTNRCGQTTVKLSLRLLRLEGLPKDWRISHSGQREDPLLSLPPPPHHGDQRKVYLINRCGRRQRRTLLLCACHGDQQHGASASQKLSELLASRLNRLPALAVA